MLRTNDSQKHEVLILYTWQLLDVIIYFLMLSIPQSAANLTALKRFNDHNLG